MTEPAKKVLDSLRCTVHQIPLMITDEADGSITVICPNCANICRHCRRQLPSEMEVCGCGTAPYLPDYGVEYCENCARFCDPLEAAMYEKCREEREAADNREREAEEERHVRNQEYRSVQRQKRDAAKARRDRAKGAS